MATIADKATISAALLPPVDSTTAKRKKKKSKKKSAATTTTTDSIPQQKVDATADTSSDAVPMSPFTFSQALKEFSEAQESEGDLEEALTRFWRHAYRLGEDGGRFEASREMEQIGYQKGYDAALAKLTAAGHQFEGECTAGQRARVDAEISESMQEGSMEAADDAFQRGKEAGLDEGRKAGYCDGLDEGRLEAEKGALELFFEGCSAGRKDGTAKEKESWITAGHAESGVCRAGRKGLVDVAITVGAPSRCVADVGVTTDLPEHLEATFPTKPAPFSWADDIESIPIHLVQSACPSPGPQGIQAGPRNLSCLSSGARRPFASLQYRSKRSFIWRRPPTSYSQHQPMYQARFQTRFHRSSRALSRRVGESALDWARDPRLFRLRGALEDLGWLRA